MNMQYNYYKKHSQFALLIHFLRVYLLLECKDTFYFFRILQVIYIFPSSITIVIEHDDNFDKSSLKFLASIR